MKFQPCKNIGLYPIVDRASKLEKLYECGVKTTQLRIKDLKDKELESEVKKAVELQEKYDAQFFLNDYWKLAIRYGAYGVHLGQEDIQSADIEAIFKARLKLGISTHNPKEIEFAMSFKPSYLAMGPVYEPISKKLTYPVIGVEKLKEWASKLDYPVVAIGGITQKNISKVKSSKVEGIALISAVLDNDGNVCKDKVTSLLTSLQ